MVKVSGDIEFKGYVPLSGIDLLVKETNGDIIEFYFSLDESFYDNGEDTEYSSINVSGVFIEDMDGKEFYFDELYMN